MPLPTRGQKVSELTGETPDFIQLRSITVKPGRIVCELAIPDARVRYTTPELVAFVLESYPDLPHHACVNAVGPNFAAVMNDTSMAHLLEHLVISLQTRQAAQLDTHFVGTTEWLDEEHGLARIELSFVDDLDALRAFNEATRFLNIAVISCFA